MGKFYKKLLQIFTTTNKVLGIFILLSLSINVKAQCPPNIDFEMGDFTGWECWIGTHTYSNGKDTINFGNFPVAPLAGRHTMLTTVPGDGLDPYGSFPKNCPNGSGHSIQLGNNSGGAQAEGVSYTFTIPVGQDKFSLIYSYAVVFQDPGHLPAQQPQLQIDIKNLTDNSSIGCSSFSFIATGGLPGFFQSPNPGGNIPVWCKNWESNTINLDGNAGKTIQLFFKTGDCTFSAHFGYAYIDVNTQCGSSFTGATFCPDDTLVNISAPAGYQSYRWYNIFNTTLGNNQTLVLNPPPLSGDSLFVELIPFNGYGCPSILKAYLFDTLTVIANAGIDKKTCDNLPVQIGSPPIPGLIYRWLPTAGLSNPRISNPLATPSVSTTYTLTVTNNGGGCATTDMVNVNVDVLSDSIEVIGSADYCIGSGQSAALRVLPADSIQWYKDNVAIVGTNQTLLNVSQSGAYYAKLFSTAGCNRTTAIKQINVYANPVAAFSVDTLAQCFGGNIFNFTNNSTLATGAMQFNWSFGDGNVSTNGKVSHSYIIDGTFAVKLLVTAPGGCADSSIINVVVHPGAEAAFTVNSDNQCFKNNQFVFTNKSKISSGTLIHFWDMGDGTLLPQKDVTYSYATPGTYQVKLTADGASTGCDDDSVITIIVNPSPVAGFNINNTVQCFPNHQFTLTNTSTIFAGNMQYTWSLGDGTIKNDTSLNYRFAKPGNYSIKLVTDAVGNCRDSATVNVIVNATPFADFTVQPVCENLPLTIINRTVNNTTSTINYLWDFDNGYSDVAKSPIYQYPSAGTYSVKLSVNTPQCPLDVDTKTINLTIDAPAKGIRYADKDAAFNFPEPLQARAIGNSAIWTPPVNLDNRFSYTPFFKGLVPQLYTIQLKTATGCITIDTQLVKTNKKIKIYVPNAFTPDGNGINERLKPGLIGFTKVNYFRIYNRWGKLLYSTNSELPGWDGKVDNKLVETQTVIWMIEAVDVDGVVHQDKGSTIVLR